MALTFTPIPQGEEFCPDFDLQSIDPSLSGKNFSKADFFTGKPALFMFICNHCPYVKAIEDRLVQLALDLKALGIPTVAICSNDHPEDSLEALLGRAREKNFSFTYLHDPDQNAALDFGAVCTPDFFLYDAKSVLKYRGRLDDSWKDPSKVTRRDLFEAAKEILAAQAPSAPVVPSMGCSLKWSDT